MLRRLIPIASLLVLFPAAAQAQCTGQAPTKTYCGNDGLTTALPSFKTISSMPFPNVAGGTVVGNRTTSAAAATGLTNPILGIPGTSTGEIGFAGATSGTVTIKPQAAAGTYNFNLPTSAGTAGQPLLSGGGGAAAQTYGTLQVPAGGTGLTSGTSGGIPYFSSNTTIASSAALTANAIVLGGGAGVTPATLGSLGTTTTVLHGNAAGAPTFAAVSLTADVTGVLPETRGGTNQSTYTLGDTLYASGANTLSKLAGNTTATIKYLAQTGTGTISAAPAWTTISGSDITGAALTKVDDTNVTLTLGGTPTTALLRAASLTLGWSGQLAVGRGGTGLGSGTSGGLLYFSASNTIASSAALTVNQIMVGGGAGAAPTTFACATTTTLVHGGTPPTCSQVVYADIATAAIATQSQYYSATSNVLVPASVIYPPEVTVTYGATTTIDFDTLINGVVTLTGNISTLTLSNVRAGKSGSIRFIQDAGGSKTWPAGGNTIFKYAGGALPVLSTTGNAVDVLVYSCSTATFCTASLTKDVRNP